MRLAACVFALSIGCSPFVGSGNAEEPSLPRWLAIEWSPGRDPPQGFQDSDGAVLDGHLVTACGFCSGGTQEDNRRKPGVYPRGFLKKTWALDLANSDAAWTQVPDFPGEARQGLFAAVVDGALYFWGGFSYTEPFTYADGWRLRREGGQWAWDRLPDLPGKTTSAAMAAVGSKIYLVGGADYDGVVGFHSAHDRDKKRPRLGAQAMVFDAAKPTEGWRPLPECPGTPRFVHTLQSAGGKLYLLGGATGEIVDKDVRYGTCTVVDNWSFDPATESWKRLTDTPIGSGNFPKSASLVFQDRFIVLPGGHQYANVANPDGTARPTFGKASSKNPASGLHNDVFVYDTKTDRFGAGDPLPIDNNLPMSIVHGDRIHLLGGETGGGLVDGRWYGHHPDLLLIGKLRLTDAAP